MNLDALQNRVKELEREQHSLVTLLAHHSTQLKQVRSELAAQIPLSRTESKAKEAPFSDQWHPTFIPPVFEQRW